MCVVFCLRAQSQGCSPDPQYSVAGIYPDSATNLSTAYVGQPYSENITIITPNDTDVVYNGFNPKKIDQTKVQKIYKENNININEIICLRTIAINNRRFISFDFI